MAEDFKETMDKMVSKLAQDIILNKGTCFICKEVEMLLVTIPVCHDCFNKREKDEK